MKLKFLYIPLVTTFFACHVNAGVVPAEDIRELAQSAYTLSTSMKELQKEIKQTQNEIRQLTDLGDLSSSLMNLQSSAMGLTSLPGTLLEGVTDINFLFPKVSEDAQAAFPQEESSNPLDKATGGLASGLLSGSKKNKLPEGENAKAIVKSMQLEDNEDCVEDTGNAAVDTAKDIMNKVTGGAGGKKCPTGNEIAAKRQQLGQSKQAFARFTLSTGLVNRALAYNTINQAKKATQATTSSADTIRKAHTTKTSTTADMADTYNRLLFSGAVSNAEQAFNAADQIEGHTNVSVPMDANGLSSLLGGLAVK